MKKTTITLITLFAFFAISCNQPTRNRAETISTEIELIEFVRVGVFRNGLAAVRLDGKYGFIDTDSNIVIPPQFYDVRDFQGNFAQVRLNSLALGRVLAEYGFIDRTGTIVSEDYIETFHRGEFFERFYAYPLISAEEVARIAPLIHRWTNFYGIDLSQARLVRKETDACINCSFEENALKRFNFNDDDKFSNASDVLVDFSPNRQMYLDFMFAFYDEGEYWHLGWDTGQNVWLYDLRQRHAITVQWNGSSSLTYAAVWESDYSFILLGYTRNWDIGGFLHTINVFDMEADTIFYYQIVTDRSDFMYLRDVIFRERGIISDW